MNIELQKLLKKYFVPYRLTGILEKQLCNYPAVIYLNFRSSVLTTPELCLIIAIIREIPGLKQLSINCTGLDAEVLNELYDALNILNQLEVIWLEFDNPPANYVKKFADFVAKKNTLRTIYFTNKFLDDEGFYTIFKAIQSNRAITGVVINGGHINNRGIEEVISLLNGEQLTQFGLHVSNVTSAVLEALGNALVKAKSLKTFDFSTTTLANHMPLFEVVYNSKIENVFFIVKSLGEEKNKELEVKLKQRTLIDSKATAIDAPVLVSEVKDSKTEDSKSSLMGSTLMPPQLPSQQHSAVLAPHDAFFKTDVPPDVKGLSKKIEIVKEHVDVNQVVATAVSQLKPSS